MALGIYEQPNSSTQFSDDGTFSNPLSLTVDGVTGATIVRRYYLRNDDNTRYFTSITLKAVLASGDDIISGALEGFTWKILAGDEQPLEDQWTLVSGGNTISLVNIGESGDGDTTTFLPFWLRITVPRGVDVQSFQGINLKIDAQENLA